MEGSPMWIVELMFWGSLSIVGYGYVGYPILLALLSVWRSKQVSSAPISPQISVILAVYNEASIIEEKIKNTLQLRYPNELRQIIVVSDASTDGSGGQRTALGPESASVTRVVVW